MSKPEQEITPPEVYFNRRNLMKAGVLAASVAATAGIYRWMASQKSAPKRALRDLPITQTPPADTPMSPGNQNSAPATTADSERATAARADNGFRVAEPKTSFEDITHYNNYYEFSTDKEAVAGAAVNFSTEDWKLEVGGLAGKPKVFDLDDLKKVGALEERVYRMRCVEAWSMVIPWAGFSLSKLLNAVEPKASAKFVAFETVLDKKQMPGQRTSVLKWPYVEGLRMDEAMHPLAILALGLYGQTLLPQNGAPIRLVVPWKYGFKGCKSIVKITLTEQQPRCTWNDAAPSAYGFYANVNPTVSRPWDQSTENRIGAGTRKTLMFNGYTEQVGSLYAGMDLRENY